MSGVPPNNYNSLPYLHSSFSVPDDEASSPAALSPSYASPHQPRESPPDADPPLAFLLESDDEEEQLHPRSSELEGFWQKFYELKGKKDFLALNRLADEARHASLNRYIDLTPILVFAVAGAKEKQEISEARKLAIFDSFLHPRDTRFSRICQAWCYWKEGRNDSARVLLHSIPPGEIEDLIDLYGRDSDQCCPVFAARMKEFLQAAEF